MTQILSIVGMIILTLAIGLISYIEPSWLSDSNEFLRGFVNHEFLALLGVIVTITLASGASLHLELNRLENATGEGFFEARRAVRSYAYLLIILFVGALILVIIKPLVAFDEISQSLFNGGAILIIALNILSLLDLTGTVFDIPADRNLRKPPDK